MAGQLVGKVVLVSGAGGTKGLALAKILSVEGARLLLTDINEEGLRRNAAEFESDAVRFTRLDVTRESDWAAAMDYAKATFGRLDVLVYSTRAWTRNPDLASTSLEGWREQVAVNLDGAFLGMKHAIPLMHACGGGSIVTVVSLSGVTPVPSFPVYSASHAGLLSLTKSVAVNCARAGQNIRANSVLCGPSSNSPFDSVHEYAKKEIPIGRPATGDDIARAILWFASDQSSYVTGSSITVDGGYSCESYREG
jgi:NAD(P)-dependent dehydrogenase (short-subunit alcohol dehydrogenase family)